MGMRSQHDNPDSQKIEGRWRSINASIAAPSGVLPNQPWEFEHSAFEKPSEYHGISSGVRCAGWKEIEIVCIAKGGEVVDGLCDARSRLG
jgi:hypothetical protein